MNGLGLAQPCGKSRRTSETDEGGPTHEQSLNVHQSTEMTSPRQNPEQSVQLASQVPSSGPSTIPRQRNTKLMAVIATVSHLTLFSLLGTLARIGLQRLTTYPGAPVVTGVLWANFGGSLIMGFLHQNRKLFQIRDPGDVLKAQRMNGRALNRDSIDNGFLRQEHNHLQDASVPASRHTQATTANKTIPLYIGLTTGFCGSFTAFSSFIRDAFLALSNDLPSPSETTPRSRGDSLMAVLAIIILTTFLCLSAFHVGSHLGISLEPLLTRKSLPSIFFHPFLNRLVILIACSSWLTILILTITTSSSTHTSLLFSLLFAPPGCILRFYISTHLNRPSFPRGTFLVNILGTLILGIAWDLQHLGAQHNHGLYSVRACQVLQGLQLGFCGCLTTVSAWVLELSLLSGSSSSNRGRNRSVYAYAFASVGLALALLVAVMGGLRWSVGFADPACA